MKNKLKLIFLLLPAMFMVSCVDLDEVIFDELTPEQAQADPNIIYVILRGSPVQPFTYPGSEFVWFIQTSTDEVAVPIKWGGHWKDDYIYRQMQHHTWDAHNNILLSAWNYCYNIIGVCNAELRRKERYNAHQLAQIRLVRAYAYWKAMDLFGNIPIVREHHTGSMPRNSTREEVFRFIESELNDTIMNHLRCRRTSEIWNQAILNTLRARLYLNANVYLGLDNESEEYRAYLEKVIAAANNVINSNRFSVSDYFRSFFKDNDLLENSTDIIASIPYSYLTLGNYLQMLGFPGGANHGLGVVIMSNSVNGPVVNPGKTADDPNALFNLFDTHDIRRLSMIGTPIRYRFNFDGTPTDPSHPLFNTIVNLGGGINPIISPPLLFTPFFTTGFADWNGSADNSRALNPGLGARMMKYEMSANQAWEMTNDLVIMRFTEVLYMKAEALIRLGRGGEAMPIFQQVLSHRGYSGANIGYEDGDIYPHLAISKRGPLFATMPLTAMPNARAGLGDAIQPTLEFMEREWRREFAFENRRRTDMIRFGSFFGTWGLKPTPSPQYRAIFPIPAEAMRRNPNLIQNPGY